MQIKLFTIPALDSELANEEMNKFLRSHKVIGVQQEFVPAENGAYWCFSIKYIQGENINIFSGKKEKIDYREILDQNTFKIFSKLREYRKEIAKNDAVPAYAVFTDAELSAIAKLPEITSEKIKTIKGIGIKKLEKYGKLILEMYQKNETSRKSDT
ncbi:MAG: HRDC domain-containing protein [Bacteroidales bacterium]|nr:HRDC domain-containing protein [Bacteroidales bacterium]